MLLMVSGGPLRAQINYKELIKAANSGDPQAMYTYAFILAVGDETDPKNKVKQSFSSAFTYYKKAADAVPGVREAQYKVGFMYEKGSIAFKGGPKADLVQAAKYYKMAAEGEDGIGEAKYALARFYKNEWGNLVDSKYAEQSRLLKEAAFQGVTDAQAELIVYYLYGKGVIKDLVIAWAWAMVAADQGDKEGMDKCLNIPELYKKELKPGDIDLARKTAEKFKRDIRAVLEKNFK